MTLLNRMNKPERPITILESVLKSLNEDGVLDDYVQKAIEEQIESLGKHDQEQLRKSPVNSLLGNFEVVMQKYRRKQLHKGTISDYLLNAFIQEVDTPPTTGITREWLEQYKPLFYTIIEDEGIQLTQERLENVWARVVSEYIGFGPLGYLMDDSSVTEIAVLNYDSIYIVRNGQREKSKLQFKDNNHVRRIADRLFQDLDVSSTPIRSARLEDNTIVTYVYPFEEFNNPQLIIHKAN